MSAVVIVKELELHQLPFKVERVPEEYAMERKAWDGGDVNG
jgi:hypothetical protein